VVGAGGLVIDRHPPSPGNPEGRLAYVTEIATSADHAGNGVVQGILGQVLDAARAARIELVSLHVADGEREIYERHGFTASNEMRLRLDTDDVPAP
jgi:ribosomal protein S18 acetylase RimI-like enzyme